MRILYAASDQRVPGTTGGSIHVVSVAEGLARLGHEVHVLITPTGPINDGNVRWIALPPPAGRKQLRWANTGAVRSLARDLKPDVIIERYYNFGGEGIRSAAEVGALAVLEVNAPVVDYPGSGKQLLDRALIFQPMRRWREYLCAQSDMIVTPSTAILPADTPSSKVVQLEWGADTDRFRPGIEGPVPFDRPADTVAVFSGAFRNWHGTIHIITALRELRARGRNDVGAVLIGDGPELTRVREAARGLDGIVFTGALPHDRIPACLAACDFGVAPFDPETHPALSLGFYWSPLKIFEYMAAGLPVVAPAIDRIAILVGHNREGLLYDTAIRTGLPHAFEALTDVNLRRRLGRAARERAVRDYSWAAHCRALEQAMTSALDVRAKKTRVSRPDAG
ncbi:MAG TPA: glycosyltransferase [Vicinamibacterales bacterium]|jgi:glycosyltransferase involved in cell wall biosynthesis|nr:glycosyltransferase [Vicinamibacterales bacterium]